MKTNDKTYSSSTYDFNEDQWNLMSRDISNTVFSDIADSGGSDLGILKRANRPSEFKDKQYLAMKLTNPRGLTKHLIYMGGSNNEPLTWTIEKDITSMQSGAYASFGHHGKECLITSCLKTALFLRFKLGISVACSFNMKNTNDVVENIQRLAQAKGNKSPIIFVLCEDTPSTEDLHEAIIELEPRTKTLISHACNRPELLSRKIKSEFTKFKDTQKYRDLIAKTEKISQYSMQKHIPGGDKLFKDIYNIIKVHIEIRDSDLVLAVLFILFTYVFRKSSIIPILYVASPESGAGKTIFLSLAMALCTNPKDTSDVTPATLADYSSTYETVIVDEFDQNQNKEGIVAIINAGYRPAVANRTRIGADGKAVVQNIASAKILAGIGYPEAPTIRERSIFINLQVCKNSTKFPDVDLSGLGLSMLKEECEKWAVLAIERFALQSMDEDHLVDIKRRLVDNYDCLLKVANCLSEEIFMMGVNACKKNAIDEKPLVSENVELIIDILKIVNTLDGKNISRDQLTDLLIAMPGRPWKSKSMRGVPFSNRVVNLLKSYRIHTGAVRIETKNVRGYANYKFDVLMERFKPELGNSTSAVID